MRRGTVYSSERFPHNLTSPSTSSFYTHPKFNMPPLNASFVDAIRVTPQGNNKYSAHLRPEWCIGTGT